MKIMKRIEAKDTGIPRYRIVRYTSLGGINIGGGVN